MIATLERVVQVGNEDGPATSGIDLIVGFGSSAGGLEALQSVVRHLPLGRPIAYVIAQHVSPQHRSLMAQLLDKETPLRVVFAEDGQTLEADTVYVIPPNADGVLRGDTISLLPPASGAGAKPSIDALFLSLADRGPGAAAVLLSGTGDDGTYGMREVRAHGGLTVAQRPDTAKYEDMPNSAIRAGVAELVLDPEEIGGVLGHPPTDGELTDAPVGEVADEVIQQLRRDGAGDFSQYKKATIQRQIARRMAILQLLDDADYLTYLKANPSESRMLRQALLVSVTAFRRDPGAWDTLGTILAGRWRERTPEEPLRIWVPGCATGEEAYTMGMLVHSALPHVDTLANSVKIFATDLDDVALDFARHGRYPVQAIAGLPREWQERYFQVRSGVAEVAPFLREATVFAHHDVTTDPAFIKLDIVSLRNLLIYFRASLQRRVLEVMHYALRPGGLLFLGGAEGVAGMQEHFVQLSGKMRIFERMPGGPQHPPERHDAPRPRTRSLRSHPPQSDTSWLVRDALVRSLSPNMVVVDSDDRVIEIVGDTADFLTLSSGPFDDRLSSLIRHDLDVDVRAALVQARATSSPAQIMVSGEDRVVTLRAVPLSTSRGEFVALSYSNDPLADVPASESDAVITSTLRQELAHTREALQATIQELETSNEELQATNEEMTASSEELQAGNEELETINEELQATNEELASLNQELQVRQRELTEVNEDLENIQNSLAHAMIMVDSDLRVTRYSPLAVRIFALVEADVGRSLAAIPGTVPTGPLVEAVSEVVADGERRIVEVRGESNAHLVHIVPYKTAKGVTRGAILSFSDVTHAAAPTDDTDFLMRGFRAMTEGLDEVVWLRNEDGSLSYVNRAVQDLFGISVEQAMADHTALDDMMDPDDRVALGATGAIDRPRVMVYTVHTPMGDRRVEDVVHDVVEGTGGTKVTVGSIRVVPALDMSATGSGEAVSALLGLADQLVLLVDQRGVIKLSGQASAEMLGIGPGEMVGRRLADLTHDLDAGLVMRLVAGEPSDPNAAHRIRLVTRGGTVRWARMRIGQVPGREEHVVTLSDITANREHDSDLGRRAMFDGATGLLNRATFIDTLSVEMSRQKRHGGRTGVLWVDLDGFKSINDANGHRIGDQVLWAAAERLHSVSRRQDAIGRLGGDEFGVLITDADRPDAVELAAQRILDVISEPTETDVGIVRVTASIGVALVPDDAHTVEGVLNAADAAMYAAKKAGGDRFTYYTEGMNEEAEQRADLRQRLAEGLRRREFVLHYQPIVRPDDLSVWGVETLVRWAVDGGLVPAGEFIGVAEQTGQIRYLGQQVLDTLAGEADDLLAILPDGARVSVNLSVAELEESRNVDILHRTVLPVLGDHLIAEVTESALLEEGSAAFTAIEGLVRAGAGLAMDDFGTGYANLSALYGMSPTVIKADQSLLENAVSGDRRHSALLQAVVALSQAVGSVALAEGVSDASRLERVRSFGFDLAQGFHLARPMALGELADFVGSTRDD